MKRIVPILLGLVLLGLLVSCGSSDPETISKIDTAEATWEASPIQNYDIEVQRQRGTNASQFIYISVRDGEVSDVSHDCAPAPNQTNCNLEPESADGYTVEGLFERARNEANRTSVLSFSDRTGVMSFMSLRNNLNIRVTFSPVE